MFDLYKQALKKLLTTKIPPTPMCLRTTNANFLKLCLLNTGILLSPATFNLLPVFKFSVSASEKLCEKVPEGPQLGMC